MSEVLSCVRLIQNSRVFLSFWKKGKSIIFSSDVLVDPSKTYVSVSQLPWFLMQISSAKRFPNAPC